LPLFIDSKKYSLLLEQYIYLLFYFDVIVVGGCDYTNTLFAIRLPLLNLVFQIVRLLKSVALLVFMLQFLFHLLSAIPRDKLPANLCCETSYQGYFESACMNVPTFLSLF
jgi:hypothetical protein